MKLTKKIRKEIAAYVRENIVDWDAKCQLALTCIGNRMTIPNWFRNEMENCIEEWCSDHDIDDPDEFIEDMDDFLEGREGIIWEE